MAMPVSSSSEMKQWPLAVPGRWRQMTWPAMMMCCPWLQLMKSEALRGGVLKRRPPSWFCGLLAWELRVTVNCRRHRAMGWGPVVCPWVA